MHSMFKKFFEPHSAKLRDDLAIQFGRDVFREGDRGLATYRSRHLMYGPWEGLVLEARPDEHGVLRWLPYKLINGRHKYRELKKIAVKKYGAKSFTGCAGDIVYTEEHRMLKQLSQIKGGLKV